MGIITPFDPNTTHHITKMDFSSDAPQPKNFIKKRLIPAIKRVLPVAERVLPVAARFVPALAPAAAVVGALRR
jgi:hypothetical protein